MMMNLTASNMETILSVLRSKDLETVLRSSPGNKTDALAEHWVLVDGTVEYNENHPNGGVGAFSITPFPDHYFVVRLILLSDCYGCHGQRRSWAVLAPEQLPARIVKVGS